VDGDVLFVSRRMNTEQQRSRTHLLCIFRSLLLPSWGAKLAL
jgi:hypothetical protein